MKQKSSQMRFAPWPVVQAALALAAVGYVNYSVVTPQLRSMVVDICIWPLFAMGILCFIMLKAYPLHGEFNTKMRAELKERRANKNV